MSARLVILASGSGSTCQALLDCSVDPAWGADVVAVGTDRQGVEVLTRAAQAGVPTFTLSVKDCASREAWDEALAETVASYEPDLVVSAGFMKLVGPAFLSRLGDRYINSHPALLPSFPGMHGPRDALEYGVKIAGCTLFFVDAGVDTGPIIAQASVPVLDNDSEASLHERIKAAERGVLVEYVGRLARQGWTVRDRKVSIP